MTEWMDASILDENDPAKRDPRDLYNPDSPNQPPYTPEFLERYHQAQIARNRRTTQWVKEKPTNSRQAAGPMTSSPLSCTAPWPTRAGWIRRSIPTNAPRGPAIWVILRW